MAINLKLKKSMEIIGVGVIILIAIRLIGSFYWGNPFTKIVYYFGANSYLEEKYMFETKVLDVEYDFKQSEYHITAEAPGIDSITFSVYVDNTYSDTIYFDDLFVKKWCNDIKSKVEEIIGISSEGTVSVRMSNHNYDITTYRSQIETIPYYFDVKEFYYGDIYVVVRSNIYNGFNDELKKNKLYKSIKSAIEPNRLFIF